MEHESLREILIKVRDEVREVHASTLALVERLERAMPPLAAKPEKPAREVCGWRVKGTPNAGKEAYSRGPGYQGVTRRKSRAFLFLRRIDAAADRDLWNRVPDVNARVVRVTRRAGEERGR